MSAAGMLDQAVGMAVPDHQHEIERLAVQLERAQRVIDQQSRQISRLRRITRNRAVR